MQGHTFPSFFEGQFIVRKEGILRHPRVFYEGLMQLFRAPPEHWIHRDTSGGVHKVSQCVAVSIQLPALWILCWLYMAF